MDYPTSRYPEVYGNSYHRRGYIFRAMSSTSDAAWACEKNRDRLSLFGRFNQYTVYFQINFQAFGCIFGFVDIIERASDNTVAIVL